MYYIVSYYNAIFGQLTYYILKIYASRFATEKKVCPLVRHLLKLFFLNKNENPSQTWPLRDGFLFVCIKPTHLVGGCLSTSIVAHTSSFYKKNRLFFELIIYVVFYNQRKALTSTSLFTPFSRTSIKSISIDIIKHRSSQSIS